MSVMSRSTPTERPDVAFVTGKADEAIKAMMATASILFIGLNYPQSSKDYDSFASDKRIIHHLMKYLNQLQLNHEWIYFVCYM